MFNWIKKQKFNALLSQLAEMLDEKCKAVVMAEANNKFKSTATHPFNASNDRLQRQIVDNWPAAKAEVLNSAGNVINAKIYACFAWAEKLDRMLLDELDKKIEISKDEKLQDLLNAWGNAQVDSEEAKIATKNLEEAYPDFIDGSYIPWQRERYQTLSDEMFNDIKKYPNWS